MRRNWIKLYVNQCLRGTMMKEMIDPAERFVWFGFLLLAGDSPFEGKITLTEDIGYTDEQIASLLECPTEVVFRAKEKMLEHEKIRIKDPNIIEIVNWNKYQSEYQRQRDYRDEYKRRKVTTQSYNAKLRIDRDRDKKEIRKRKEREKKKIKIEKIVRSANQKKIILNFETKAWEGITDEDKELWAKTFPGCDIDLVLQEMIAYWDAQPPAKRKVNWKRTIVARLKWIQDHGGTKDLTDKSEDKFIKWKKERGEYP